MTGSQNWYERVAVNGVSAHEHAIVLCSRCEAMLVTDARAKKRTHGSNPSFQERITSLEKKFRPPSVYLSTSARICSWIVSGARVQFKHMHSMATVSSSDVRSWWIRQFPSQISMWIVRAPQLSMRLGRPSSPSAHSCWSPGWPVLSAESPPPILASVSLGVSDNCAPGHDTNHACLKLSTDVGCRWFLSHDHKNLLLFDCFLRHGALPCLRVVAPVSEIERRVLMPFTSMIFVGEDDSGMKVARNALVKTQRVQRTSRRTCSCYASQR